MNQPPLNKMLAILELLMDHSKYKFFLAVSQVTGAHLGFLMDQAWDAYVVDNDPEGDYLHAVGFMYNHSKVLYTNALNN
jgi:hypothetical protein